MICERIYKDNSKFKLIKNDKEGKEEILNLKGLNIYISNLMHQLWEQPKLVYLILSNANIKDMKNNLAYFICNNFYENILNPNNLEDNLLFVICLLLKKEINNLRDVKDASQFLMESTCGFLLEQLKERKDIQLYFKNILLDIIQKTEEVFSSKVINFDIKKIEDEIKVLKQEKKDPKSLKEKKDLKSFYLQKNKEITLDFDEDNNENNKKMDKDEEKKVKFHKKYMLSMTLDELKKLYKINEENKDKEVKDEMKDYIQLHINFCESNPDIYKNDTFIQTISSSKLSQDIFSLYQNIFTGLIEIISQLFKNLLDNINLLPYSIKAISKIIILLLKKKFPNITIIQQNMFLSKFFFNQLMLNMLNNPSLSLLIEDLISDNTINNLKLISSFLIKFISCKLYQNYINECSFTPFNWFFFDEMPNIIKFFKNIAKNVKLPLIINKVINGELEKDITFEYFKEKKDIIGHKSICYSYNDLFILLDSIEKSKNIIFVDDKSSLLKKTYEKLTKENAAKILNNIKKNIDYEIIKIQKDKKDKIEIKRPIIKYFLIYELLTNSKCTDLFNKKNENENMQLNNIFTIKNNIYQILNNNKIINELDFDINNENIKDIQQINFIKILNKFKELNDLSNYSFDDIINENKKINWLIDDLCSVGEDIKKNDYQDLLIEIYQETIKSINSINYKDLIYCLDKFEISKKYNNLYQKAKNIILNIDINNKIKNIIDNEIIPVELYFKYDENIKELKIEKFKKVKKLSKDKLKEQKQGNYFAFEIWEVCQTIKDFINNFPDIAIISVLNEDYIFDIHKQMKINQKLEDYFKILESHFEKITCKGSSNNLSFLSDNIKYYFDKEESEKIILKLKDYIIEKLYEKIFPKVSDFLDNKIYLNSLKLSWTEPKHYMKEEITGKNNDNFDFKRFIGEMKIVMKKLEKVKIPSKKVELIYNIIEIMEKCFNNKVKVNYGQDFFKDLLIFTIVKINPSWLHSNCLFISTFIETHTNKTGESMFQILCDACKFFEEISYKNLLGVTEKEFNEKCEESLNDVDNDEII